MPYHPFRIHDLAALCRRGLLIIAFLLPPLAAQAGISEAHRDCNNRYDAKKQLAGCSEIIDHYLHRYKKIDQAMAYAQRAQAKIKLNYPPDSINPDLQRACDLGDGLACCTLAGWYYGEWMDAIVWGDDEKAPKAKTERLLNRAEALGVDEQQCKQMFGHDGP